MCYLNVDSSGIIIESSFGSVIKHEYYDLYILVILFYLLT